jgi:hypothetical protein
MVPAVQPQVETRSVDDKCRMTLPKQFANATVTMELVSEDEVRIRRAVVVPVADLPLPEQFLTPLSDRDRDLFLIALDNPPKPNAAFRAAAKRYNKRHG